jgi:hypothetical protein
LNAYTDYTLSPTIYGIRDSVAVASIAACMAAFRISMGVLKIFYGKKQLEKAMQTIGAREILLAEIVLEFVAGGAAVGMAGAAVKRSPNILQAAGLLVILAWYTLSVARIFLIVSLVGAGNVINAGPKPRDEDCRRETVSPFCVLQAISRQVIKSIILLIVDFFLFTTLILLSTRLYVRLMSNQGRRHVGKYLKRRVGDKVLVIER